METLHITTLKFLIVLILLIEKVSSFNLEKECGLLSNTKSGTEKFLEHGKTIQAEQWPWMAALYYGFEYICGGTIGMLYLLIGILFNSQAVKKL